MQIENVQNGIVCAYPNPSYNETAWHMLALTVFFSFYCCLRGFLLIFALRNQFFYIYCGAFDVGNNAFHLQGFVVLTVAKNPRIHILVSSYSAKYVKISK